MTQNELNALHQALVDTQLIAPNETTIAGYAERIEDNSKLIRATNEIGRNPAAKDWLAGVVKRARQAAGEANTSEPASPPTAERQLSGGLEKSKPNRNQLHIYGGKAALTIEADETRAGTPTISIDAAPATAPRQYDWSSKLRLQVTAKELPVVAAVVAGYSSSCEFKNHGDGNNKGFSITAQQTGLFMRVFGPERLYAVPVDAADGFYFGALVLEQVRKACPTLDGRDLAGLLKACANRYQQPEQRRAAQ